MWQTVTAWATAGEQNSKWWLTPTNKYFERSEYLNGVLGDRSSHGWGLSERVQQNKHARDHEHQTERSGVSRSAMGGCACVSRQGQRKKYYPKRSEVWRFFLSCLLYPCGYVFANKASDWRTPYYLLCWNGGRILQDDLYRLNTKIYGRIEMFYWLLWFLSWLGKDDFFCFYYP